MLLPLVHWDSAKPVGNGSIPKAQVASCHLPSVPKWLSGVGVTVPKKSCSGATLFWDQLGSELQSSLPSPMTWVKGGILSTVFPAGSRSRHLLCGVLWGTVPTFHWLIPQRTAILSVFVLCTLESARSCLFLGLCFLSFSVLLLLVKMLMVGCYDLFCTWGRWEHLSSTPHLKCSSSKMHFVPLQGRLAAVGMIPGACPPVVLPP